MAFDRIWRDKIDKTLILDSSAILMFFEFSDDWERELYRILGAYHFVVPTAVIEELRVLARLKKKEKKVVAALKLIEKYEKINVSEKSADEALIKVAEKTNGIVMTNDRELRKRLKDRGFSVIFLRGRKKLAMDE